MVGVTIAMPSGSRCPTEKVARPSLAAAAIDPSVLNALINQTRSDSRLQRERGILLLCLTPAVCRDVARPIVVPHLPFAAIVKRSGIRAALDRLAKL